MEINYFKTALSHHAKGNWNKAKEIYEHILKSNPNNYSVLQNYGPLLCQLKEFKLAKIVFERSLKINPQDPMLLYNYGKFFHDQKIFEKAIEYYNKSFAINPKNAMSHYNIGNIYLTQGKLKNAIKSFDKATVINPSNFYAYNNIGISLKKLGKFQEALKFYEKAIKINKDYVDGHLNYSTLLLSLNKLDLGFKEYEYRKKSKIFSDYLNYSKLNIKSPIWKGESLEKKTILIFSEQGIGDLIQFTRYLFLLIDTYKCKVILKLKQNLKHFFYDDRIKIINEEQKIPHHDYHNHLVSLPGIFYKKNKEFPKSVNFIKENKKIIKKWTDIISKYKGLKVGINSHSTATVGERIIPLEKFGHLTKEKQINFFVIQKDFNRNNIKIINSNSNVNYFEDIDKHVNSFEDTIGIIKNLDLVITADTSLCHLSATLGKPTWVALPFVSDWRWFQDQTKSVWYENVKLYRQKAIGDWEEVFKLIHNDLMKKI
tara:strand:- start:702 stop:2156 length:1455 start_codon:yes stop_codon:yes gene_type:complete